MSVPGLAELDAHLDALLSPAAATAAAGATAEPEPTLTLASDLFDDLKLRVNETNAAAVAAVVLHRLVALLKSPAVLTGQGPFVNTDAVCSLAVALLRQPVEGLAFADVLAVAPTAVLVEALGRDATPATNKLALAVLEKAAGPRASAAAWQPSPQESSNVATVVHDTALLQAFLVCWLTSPDTGVGDTAERVLLQLLDAAGKSSDRKSDSKCADLLWNSMSKQVFAECRDDNDAATTKTALQISLAQSRVLGILPSLACLDLSRLTKTDKTNNNNDNLLDFAGRMVDESDPLMARNLDAFYVDLVSHTRALLAASDKRNGTPRSSRPSIQSVDDIADPQLRFQVETLAGVVRTATSGKPALLAQLRSLANEAAAAAERGLVTRDDADDMQTWVGLLLEARAVPMR